MLVLWLNAMSRNTWISNDAFASGIGGAQSPLGLG
jgi:hypothetical protein